MSPGSKCRWPQKATRIVLDLVRNAESNAEVYTSGDAFWNVCCLKASRVVFLALFNTSIARRRISDRVGSVLMVNAHTSGLVAIVFKVV